MLNLIDESGKLTYQKKLDFEPLTFKVYNIIVVSSTKNHVFNL